MAASTLTSAVFQNNTDANFRAWVSAIIAAIVAGGWVQTADTGQINTATVTAPAVLSTSQGYAVFRSNDAGGGLNEFYVKIEFGSGPASALRPGVWVTFGWSTDGAGTLTGAAISTRTQVACGTNPVGPVNINFASGSGYFLVAETSATAQEHMVFGVERTRDASLNFKNEVLAIMSNSTGGFAPTTQTITQTNAFPVAGSGTNYIMPPIANTPVAGVAGLGLIFGMAPGNTSPSINIFGVENNSIGAYQDIVAISILGVPHNYRLQRILILGGVVSAILLTRYE